MFGKRAAPSLTAQPGGSRVAPAGPVDGPPPKSHAVAHPPVQTERRSETYFQTKSLIFGALIEAIDLAALSKLDAESAREEIRDIVHEIVTIKNLVLSIAEQEDLLDDICNDVLGFGPLEPLLARDEIADIMVNGPTRCFIEVGGKIQLTNSDERPLSGQHSVDEHLPEDREPSRTSCRRSLADLRRSPA
jgi:pilus assembly protein CpaF